MIPVLHTGTSFKGAGLYYLHDKKLEGETGRTTTERVAWTHTENTMHDDPQAALAEMRITFFDQQRLREASGNRTDGRPIERPVVTVALSWSPEQEVSKEQMIAAGRSYLAHMGWQDQQCLMVCHDDTRHPHMHLIVNSVHPENGMAMDMSWTKNRSSRWAYNYEKEHGHIFCKAREDKYEHGRAANDQSMNRWEWKAWQEIARESAVDPEFQAAVRSGEWDALKGGQREERLAFWKETGQMRRELQRELRQSVRDEFKGDWQTYARNRNVLMNQRRLCDPASRQAYSLLHRRQLKAMRSDIQNRQKARIAELAAPAFDNLSKARAQEYDKLKAQHRAEKAGLRIDQAQGSRRRDLLHAHDPANQNGHPALTPQTGSQYIQGARKQVQTRHEWGAASNDVATPAPAAAPEKPREKTWAEICKESWETPGPFDRATPSALAPQKAGAAGKDAAAPAPAAAPEKPREKTWAEIARESWELPSPIPVQVERRSDPAPISRDASTPSRTPSRAPPPRFPASQAPRQQPAVTARAPDPPRPPSPRPEPPKAPTLPAPSPMQALTPVQQTGYRLQYTQQQAAPSQEGPAARAAPASPEPAPRGETTDRKAAASKSRVLTDRERELDERAARRRTYYQASPGDRSRERGDDDGGRER
jgi:MobA/VirD2-like, nuclease domain